MQVLLEAIEKGTDSIMAATKPHIASTKLTRNLDKIISTQVIGSKARTKIHPIGPAKIRKEYMISRARNSTSRSLWSTLKGTLIKKYRELHRRYGATVLVSVT